MARDQPTCELLMWRAQSLPMSLRPPSFPSKLQILTAAVSFSQHQGVCQHVRVGVGVVGWEVYRVVVSD